MSTRWRQRLWEKPFALLLCLNSSRCDWGRHEDSGRPQSDWRWGGRLHLSERPQWGAVCGESGVRWRQTGSGGVPASETSQYPSSPLPPGQAAPQTGQPGRSVTETTLIITPAGFTQTYMSSLSCSLCASEEVSCHFTQKLLSTQRPSWLIVERPHLHTDRLSPPWGATPSAASQLHHWGAAPSTGHKTQTGQVRILLCCPVIPCMLFLFYLHPLSYIFNKPM